MVVKHAGLAPGAYGYLIYITIPHEVWVTLGLLKYIRDNDPPHRIDGLIIATLSSIPLVWRCATIQPVAAMCILLHTGYSNACLSLIQSVEYSGMVFYILQLLLLFP